MSGIMTTFDPMTELQTLDKLQSIDLDIRVQLQERDFRREWFRAELESYVPEAFRELRELRGLTQGGLAKSIGTQQPAVSRFERSTSPVWEFDFLLRMAEALDARLRVLIEPAEKVLHEYSEDPAPNAVPPQVLAQR